MWRPILAGVAAATSVAYVGLSAVALGSGLATPNAVAWLVLSAPPMVVAAAFLMWKRPDNPIGGLLMLVALCTVVLPTVLEIATVLRYDAVGAEPWMWAPMWAAVTLGIVGTTAGAAMLAVLPDGRVRYRHERVVLPLGAGLALLPALGLLTNEHVYTPTFQFPGVGDIASPFFVAALEPVGPAITAAGLLASFVFLVGIGALFVRYRRTTPREQRQLRWVLLAGAVALTANGIPLVLGQLGLVPELQHDLVALVTFLPTLLVPFAVVAAVMEPAWIDVDWVIRKSFVYGSLSALILALYVGAAALIGLTAGSELPIELAIVLTVIGAVALQPVRARLQGLADRWVFGVRPSPSEAIADFGTSVDDVADPVELVGQLAASAREALRLEWAAAEVAGVGRRTAGERTGTPALSTEIRHRGVVIGRLDCGPPADGSLRPEDVALLRALSGQAGLAITNASLVGRIVQAQDEERRRIERDLHDGVQQELVALIARLAVAGSRLEAGDLDVASIDEVKTEAQRILADVRELAQGIHPSIVTDGGIVAAVEERCARLPIAVTLDAQPGLRRARFAAPIEGAAYFLVAEALANVLKHARASRATVSLARAGGRLSISVADDGAGFDPGSARRRGLAGLEDRLAALGGAVDVVSAPGRGTRVSAWLPVEP